MTSIIHINDQDGEPYCGQLDDPPGVTIKHMLIVPSDLLCNSCGTKALRIAMPLSVDPETRTLII